MHGTNCFNLGEQVTCRSFCFGLTAQLGHLFRFVMYGGNQARLVPAYKGEILPMIFPDLRYTLLAMPPLEK